LFRRFVASEKKTLNIFIVSALWFGGWQILIAANPFFQTDFESQDPKDNLILMIVGLQFLSFSCAVFSVLVLIMRFFDFRKARK
jgi:hypothetical protein